MSRKQNKNGFTFYTKNGFQILLWLIEVIGIPTLCVLFSKNIAPFNPDSTFFDYIERYLVCYAIYQIFIFIVISSINDSKKDQTLALINVYEYLQLYFDTRDEKVREFLLNRCRAQQDPGVMNSAENRKEYDNISKIINTQIDEQTITHVKYRIIYLKHVYEGISLLWKYSILVRLFK